MPTIEAEIDIDVYCDNCNEMLKSIVSDKKLYVNLCQTCLKEYREGKD